MRDTGEKFTITYKGEPALVSVYTSKNKTIYLVGIPVPIFITEALDANMQPFWTSIPEGRLELAKTLGMLIEAHNSKPPAGQASLF